MNGPTSSDLVRTTETSLAVVEALSRLDEARVEEITEEVDVAASTVHRHLQTLRAHGYVVKESDFYRLGLQFLTVGGYVRDRRPEYDLAKETCESLAEETDERAQFEVEERGERVFLHTAVGDRAVRANGTIGRRGPLHCSAAGKAMLASFPDDYVAEIIERRGLEAVTENTVTDRDALFDELETVREEGIAFNREESTMGLHAVASVVRMPSGETLGALSVSGPAHRMEGAAFTETLPNTVRGAAQELELNIEYSKYV
jgi:DNA-binding IclR family transcriptional regulator